MVKFYKSANYIAIIKQGDIVLNCKDCKTYTEALIYVEETMKSLNNTGKWYIHKISKTFRDNPNKTKNLKESAKERIDKKYSIEEIHALFDKWDEEFGGMVKRTKERIKTDFDGHLVKTYSDRYIVFRHSTKCVKCGLEASFYRLEKSVNSKHYHFNLYGVKDGEEVLFTKDHIIPRAKGGRNNTDNYQTMCQPCNIEKADQLEIETGVYKPTPIPKLVDPSGEHNVDYMLSL